MHIVHATDFSRGGLPAFVHALAIGLVHQARLTLVHVGRPSEGPPDWSQFPGVRPQLSAWGLLAEGAGKAEVAERLGLRVGKMALPGPDPVSVVPGLLEEMQADLLVLGHGASEGSWPFARRSVSGALAGRAAVPTLVVPDMTGGFVSPRDGSLSLRRVICAVDVAPDPREAILEAAGLLGDLAAEATAVELFHVGRALPEPAVTAEDLPGARLSRHAAPGDPATEILGRLAEVGPDLLVLISEGRRGVVDMLYGSITEQVLRAAQTPVLVVPAR